MEYGNNLTQLFLAWIKRTGMIFKLGAVGLLALLLLIPLGMIYGQLYERLDRRDEAVARIQESWGGNQQIVGPVLIIPYTYIEKEVRQVGGETIEELKERHSRALYLPQTFQAEGDLSPQKRSYGIYGTIVYRADLKLTGRFARPDLTKLTAKPETIHWERARLTFGVSDLRGVGNKLALQWGEQSIVLEPGCPLNNISSGIVAALDLSDWMEGDRNFSLDLGLNGSGEIQFAPVGIENHVEISSVWPDPSFVGSYLPRDPEVTDKGFRANWQVAAYARNFPTEGAESNFDWRHVGRSAFGVALINLVDSYRTVERSIKYGVLFIGMVFGAFFLFEMLSHTRIHFVQYGLVGATLVLFYLALLALSEFIGFGAAYGLGCFAAIGMITLYCWGFLGGLLRAAAVGGGLALIYGFLYVILQLQDYSLLVGTTGLFIMLGLAMYATRDLSWLDFSLLKARDDSPEIQLPTTPSTPSQT